jgi:hypothetical protein
MLYHSAKHDLDFQLGGKRYVVPRGSEVEIPDHLAPIIRSRGLLLTEGSADGGPRVTPIEPAPRPAPHMAGQPSLREAAQEMAAIGDGDSEPDPDEVGTDGDDYAGDEDAAARTVLQLEQQGVRVPGKRPVGRRPRV